MGIAAIKKSSGTGLGSVSASRIALTRRRRYFGKIATRPALSSSEGGFLRLLAGKRSGVGIFSNPLRHRPLTRRLLWLLILSEAANGPIIRIIYPVSGNEISIGQLGKNLIDVDPFGCGRKPWL